MKSPVYFDYQENPKIRVYMNEKLKSHKTYTKGLYQLAYAATLDNIIEPIVGLPDLTGAYGLPVGGVLATDAEKGPISLNAIGGDIGCGISLSQTSIPKQGFFDSKLNINKCQKVTSSIKKQLFSDKESNPEKLLLKGAEGISDTKEMFKIENYGSLKINNSDTIDKKLIKKAEDQIGTLGGGNHFIDFLYCTEIEDKDLAKRWNINPDNIQFMIHTGSRGVGSYIKNKYSDPDKYHDKISRIFQPKKFNSEKGQEIFYATKIASNFAYANRAKVREIVEEAVDSKSELLYDFIHNNITLEDDMLVHRKGASSAFPKSHKGNVETYLETGHPIIIPGTLGTSTYILSGTDKLKNTFYSVNHGAGRKWPRGYVRKKQNQKRFKQKPENVFINLSLKNYVEELPIVYKDIDETINTLEENGLIKKVAKLKPFFVYLEQ
ncbi:hypothetical protein GF336_04705 [Candidatus Woesearchaeota archaeon]|nr:hypothetical protein [Candidatus Woesearchaeota archaeon]